MSNKINITGFLGCKKLISVNHMYINVKGNAKVKTLSEDAREEKRLLTTSLRDSGIKLGSLKDTDKVFRLTLIFYFSRLFYKRDVDNPAKLIQDTLSHYLGFDDSRIVELQLSKKQVKNKDQVEFLYYKLESLEDYNIDISYESVKKLLKA